MNIELHSLFNLHGTFSITCSLPVSFRAGPVVVTVTDEDCHIESMLRHDSSVALLADLRANTAGFSASANENELYDQFSEIRRQTESVFRWIRYYLNCEKLREDSIQLDRHWVVLEGVRIDVAPRLQYSGRAMHEIPLDDATAVAIQSYLDSNQEMLVAMRHLFRARSETNPRYMWIDGTIAAELAIKEFLIRLKPEIRTLLLELPSPPPAKLYGSILESFTGERSPKVQQIAKGVEKRNDLVHKPIETKINRQDAVNYVEQVEIAIFHLLTLLYPNDEVFGRMYKNRLGVQITKSRKGAL